MLNEGSCARSLTQTLWKKEGVRTGDIFIPLFIGYPEPGVANPAPTPPPFLCQDDAGPRPVGDLLEKGVATYSRPFLHPQPEFGGRKRPLRSSSSGISPGVRRWRCLSPVSVESASKPFVFQVLLVHKQITWKPSPSEDQNHLLRVAVTGRATCCLFTLRADLTRCP